MDVCRLSWSVAVWAASAVLFAGCGRPVETDYSGLGLVDVSGTVTLDGKPLRGATVLFEAEDQTYSYGRTDDSGRFELMFNSEQSGVIPGRKIVRVTMGRVGEEADAAEDRDEGEVPASVSSVVTIPERYNKHSELTAEVSAENRTFHFNLMSN